MFIQLHDLKTESAKSRDAMQAELEILKDNNTTMSAAQRQKMESLKAALASKFAWVDGKLAGKQSDSTARTTCPRRAPPRSLACELTFVSSEDVPTGQ